MTFLIFLKDAFLGLSLVFLKAVNRHVSSNNDLMGKP